MNSDKNGCSTCPPGQENYETYRSHITGKRVVQYDFRTFDGELFSCVATSLNQCRSKRDKWLETK